MNLPEFNAEAALGKPTRTYRSQNRYGGISPRASAQPAFVPLSPADGLEDLDADDETGLMDDSAEDAGMEDEEGLIVGDDASAMEEMEGGEDDLEDAES